MQKVSRIPMLIVSTVMLLFLGIVYAWSIFRAQLAAEFPDFTAAQLSLNFTITMACYCIGGYFGGKLTARRSPAFSARISGVLVALGFFGASFMQHLSGHAAIAAMYVFYGAIAGFGTGIGYNACVTGTSAWFSDHLGLASGVLLMGFGIGSLVFGQLTQTLCSSMRVFSVLRIFAAAVLVVMLAGSCFLKKAPARATASGSGGEGETPAQMLRRPSFWIYFVWNTIMAAAGLLVINSAATIAVYYGVAAAFGLIVSVFNGVGRPFTGWAMDRLGRVRGMAAVNGVLILAGAALVVTGKTGSTALMLLGMLCVGLCYGSGVTISAKVIRDLYGEAHYAVNFSLSNFCCIPAAFIGPYISGALQDRSGGDYASTFLMLLILAVGALAVFLLLGVQLRREDRAENES